MIDIYHPFTEIDRLNIELDNSRDGERVAMLQCSNAQAEIVRLREELELTQKQRFDFSESLIRLADNNHKETVRLHAVITDFENRESSVCPDDVGCDEYIKQLRTELERAREDRDVWMQQCEAARSSAFDTRLLLDFSREKITGLHAELTQAQTELAQARTWSAAWKNTAKQYSKSFGRAFRESSFWNDIAFSSEEEIVQLRSELVRATAAQPCGHALRFIETSNESTSYCQACNDAGAVEVALRTELDAALVKIDLVRRAEIEVITKKNKELDRKNAELAQARKELEYSERSRRNVKDDFSMAVKILDRDRIELDAARKEIERKDAALNAISERLPLHEIDEYGYHSPDCDTCAIQAELKKAAWRRD